MKISFVVPGNINEISGGHIYNREIVKSFESEDNSFELLYGKNEDEICKILSEPHEILLIDAWCLHTLDTKALNQEFHLLVHHPLELDASLHKNSSLELLFWNKAKSIIVTGENVKVFLESKTKRPVNVVVPGINIAKTEKQYYTLPINVVGFGSYIERKGDLLLLEALKFTNQSMVIHRYGPQSDNEFLDRLKSLIKENNLTNRFLVNAMVSHEEKLRILHSADLMVFPTQYESYGMAIQESLLLGIPVLTNGNLGLENRFGNMGIRYLSQNPIDWAEALTSFTTNPSEYSKICREFKDFEIRWPSWQQQARKIVGILTQ